jgi:hypothetical protein
VHDIGSFDVDAVRACSDILRTLGTDVDTMEAAADRVVRFLYDELGDGNGGRACALVRLYKTEPYGGLPADLQDFAANVLEEEPADDLRCLTLLGTAGDLPEWNARRASRGHQAIPLPSEQIVAQFPMVRQLIVQLGLEISTVIRPDPSLARELAQRTYDVFHVPEALGSPYLPAQDFVAEHGIASALGFGGMLYTGDFYAVVLFSKVPVPAPAAQMLKILALAIRVPMLRHLRRVFARAS